jgi:hypothetical protein
MVQRGGRRRSHVGLGVGLGVLVALVIALSCGSKEERPLGSQQRAVSTVCTGTQVALTSSMISVSDFDPDPAPGFPAANAIDGNLSTRWSGDGPADDVDHTHWGWIQIDLGSAKRLCKIEAYWYDPGDGRSYEYDMFADASDSSPDVLLVTGTSSSFNPKTWDSDNWLFDPTSVRYIRLYASATNSEWHSLNEIKIWVENTGGTPDGGTGGGSSLDARGIKKIYADAPTSPEQQYFDENNITSGRVDNYPNVYNTTTESIGGGRNAVQMGDTARLALYSSNGNPFGSVEHTVYFKMTAGPSTNGDHTDGFRLFQPYIGGGSHHTAEDRCCEGNAMKVCLFGGGDIAFRKEICHSAYCGDRGSYNNWGGSSHGTAVWNGPIRNMTNGMLNRWYGLKQIELHMSDRNRQEVWIDEGADNGSGGLVVTGNETRWRLLARYDDVRTGTSNGVPVGNWTSSEFSAECTSCVAESRDNKSMANGLVRLEPYSVTHTGHDISIQNTNAVVLRLDTGRTMRFGYWSLRKIQPPN